MRVRILASIAVAVSLVAGHPEARPVSIPHVIAAEVPIYPREVAAAGVKGEISVLVTTDGQRVTDARATATDPALAPLAEAAVRNARTWRFTSGIPTKFNATYRYKIVDRPCDSLGRDTHAVAVLNFPGVMDVFAERDPECPGATRLPPVFGIYVRAANVPVFPPGALAKGIDGKVVIGVTYKAVLSVTTGPDGLAEPVMNGIRDWMFNPAPYAEEFSFNYILEDGECLGGPFVTVGPGMTSFEIKDRRACGSAAAK